jgi:nucleotide-binding universal stress UspA family protein
MKKYLVPFEGSKLSKAAVDYAVQFSRAIAGSLDIIYIADIRVLSNPVFDLTVLAFQGIGLLGDLIPREQAMLELETKIIAKGDELLESLRNSPTLKPDGEPSVEFTTRVEIGNPPIFLSDISDQYDIIFMGLWGETHELKAGLWGGTSEAVIRKGKSPVFLAASEFKPYKSILIGFDNRPRSRQALAWAGMIGETMELPVTVLSACITEKGKETEVLDEAKKIAASYSTVFNYTCSELLPAKAILDIAETMPDPLICLGAFGDQPIRELFLGSVAEEVLRKTKHPVLLLK